MGAELVHVEPASLGVPALSADALNRLPEAASLDADPYWRLAAAFLVGYQGHSRSAYFSDLRAWHGWCASRGTHPLDHLPDGGAPASDRPARLAGDDCSAVVVPVEVLRVRRAGRRADRRLPDDPGTPSPGRRRLGHRGLGPGRVGPSARRCRSRWAPLGGAGEPARLQRPAHLRGSESRRRALHLPDRPPGSCASPARAGSVRPRPWLPSRCTYSGTTSASAPPGRSS
jgi:hypothetical protein